MLNNGRIDKGYTALRNAPRDVLANAGEPLERFRRAFVDLRQSKATKNRNKHLDAAYRGCVTSRDLFGLLTKEFYIDDRVWRWMSLVFASFASTIDLRLAPSAKRFKKSITERAGQAHKHGRMRVQIQMLSTGKLDTKRFRKLQVLQVHAD